MSGFVYKIESASCTTFDIETIFKESTIEDDVEVSEAIGSAVDRNPELRFEDFKRSIPWITRSEYSIHAALEHEIYGRKISAEELINRYPQLEVKVKLTADLYTKVLNTVRSLPVEEAMPMPFGPMLENGRIRYLLVRLIGEGGQGSVYEAVDYGFDDPHRSRTAPRVAIKLCLEPSSSEREAVRARAVGNINVARVFDQGTHNGFGYIVYELVHGVPLTVWRMQHSNKVPWTTAVDIAMQICSGVSAIHAAGVIHRDIKPENIMMRADNRPILTDFGISSWAQTDLNVGRSEGSVMFVAPEQFQSPAQCSPMADIYSVAGVAYWLLSGSAPNGSDAGNAFKNLRERELPRPKQLQRHGIPSRLAAVVMRSLEPLPSDRAASVTELGDELKAIRNSTPIEWIDTDTSSGALFIRRHPLAISACILIAFLVSLLVLGRFNKLDERRLLAREATMQTNAALEGVSKGLAYTEQDPGGKHTLIAWLMQEAIIDPSFLDTEISSATRYLMIAQAAADLPEDAVLERAMAHVLAADVAEAANRSLNQAEHLRLAEQYLRGYVYEDDRYSENIRDRSAKAAADVLNHPQQPPE